MASSPRRKTTPTRSRNAHSQKSSGMSVTFLVVVLIILVITVFVLAFREPLSRMNGTSSANGSPVPSAKTSPSILPNPSAKPSNLVVDGGTPPASAAPSSSPVASNSPPPSPATSPVASNKPSTSPGPLISPAPSASVKPGDTPKASPNSSTVKTDNTEMKAVTLYFTRVQDDGKISVEKVSRSISYTESPLVSSIRALLKGPAGTELSQGLVSMIPAGTTLLSAKVQDSVAYLNFSESFEFNPLGGDGLKAQVRQVVWVATEFPTVKAVQILIEGKKVQYLGGDNMAVGKPLTRQNLP